MKLKSSFLFGFSITKDKMSHFLSSANFTDSSQVEVGIKLIGIPIFCLNNLKKSALIPICLELIFFS